MLKRILPDIYLSLLLFLLPVFISSPKASLVENSGAIFFGAMAFAAFLVCGEAFSVATSRWVVRGIVFLPFALAFSFVRMDPYRSSLAATDVVITISVFFNLFIIILGSLYWISPSRKARLRRQLEESGATAEQLLLTLTEGRLSPSFEEPSLFPSLGGDEDRLSGVGRSLVARAGAAESMARMTMVAMVVLVFVGGGAAVGLWGLDALQLAQRIESDAVQAESLAVVLESQARQLEGFLGELRASGEEGISEATERMEGNLREMLGLSKTALRRTEDLKAVFPSRDRFEKDLAELKTVAQINLEDIAIRVTIAVLTLFLVQVFFAVYKYSREMQSQLAARAEALALIGDDKTAQKALRERAVQLVTETYPGFKGEAKTPIGEVAELAQKLSSLGGGQKG